MGLSMIVGSIALVPSALAFALRPYLPVPVTAVLGHVAATGFLVALAATDAAAPYSAKLLGKNFETGRVGRLNQLLLWPYHLGLKIKLWRRRRTSAEPLYNEILPGFFLGGWPATAALLPPVDPSVVDVTCELPKTHHSRYICIPTWDTLGPSPELIDRAVQWVLKEHADNRPVYIHCAHGHGRSATVLAATLIASGRADTAEEAVAIMRAARPRVRLNARQAAALRLWIDRYYRTAPASTAQGPAGAQVYLSAPVGGYKSN